MTRRKLLIVTDSRGKGLQTYLQAHIPSHQVVIQAYVLPGAKLETITEHIHKKFDTSYDLIIASGGICNLTNRATDQGNKVLSYTSVEENIVQLKDKFTSLAGAYQGKIIITTIPPASLTQYFRHFNPNQEPPKFLEEQQNVLLQDIREINETITTLNKAADLPNLDLHSKCFSSVLDPKKKGKRNPDRRRKIFLERDLTDGVHPNSNLHSKWAQRYSQVINLWLANITNSDSETSASANEEPWDYKRLQQRASAEQPSTSQQ